MGMACMTAQCRGSDKGCHCSQVDTLFQELDQLIPNNFMSQTFADSSPGLVSATPPSSNLTPAQREVCQKHPPHLAT